MPGTGLGLPLTKALVEQHGSTLDLQSQVGVGTTVTVRFPAEHIKSLPRGANAVNAAADIDRNDWAAGQLGRRAEAEAAMRNLLRLLPGLTETETRISNLLGTLATWRVSLTACA